MKKSSRPKYSRILLKLSGEALGGESGIGICPEAVLDMADQIREVRELGVVVVVVVVAIRAKIHSSHPWLA
jgi:uridylate kinase